MTLNEAFKVATADPVHPIRFTGPEEKAWNEARRVLMEHLYCPGCACGGLRSRLGDQQPGGYWTYAGRECPNCEEFYPMGEQAEYQTAGDEWRGDADPGL